MRINVYSQELTSEVKLFSKESDERDVTGIPCFPDGSPNGKLREELPPSERSRWQEAGRPSDMSGFTCIREESIVYHAAQLMLHSSQMLHHPPQNDDRSAVTFWLPKSKKRREELAKAFKRVAEIFRTAPSEMGLD